jgi:serine protease Do
MTHASVLAVSLMIGAALISGESKAQESPKAPAKEKQEKKEIIIRQKDDGKEKMTIVVDGDRVTINGKPISEYGGDDVVVRRLREVEMTAPRVYVRPRAGINRQLRPLAPLTYNYQLEGEWPEGFAREPRAFLGVTTEKTESGAKINELTKGSAAEKAGLKEGDVITTVGGKKVAGPEGLMELIRSRKPDEEVEIGYIRDKKKKTVKAKLGSTGFNDARAFEFAIPEINEEVLENLREVAPRMEFYRGDMERAEREMERSQRSMERAQLELERQHRDLERIYNAPEAFRFEFDSDMNRAARPKVGMRVMDMEAGGVKITEVEPGSPADKAGLKKDDVLAYIDGKKIEHTDQAVSGLREGREKASLPITVMRDGKPLNVEVKLPRDIKQANL